MNIIYKTLETRKYLRTHRETGESETVIVTDRNNLPVERHLELLNLNDDQYTYSEIED